MTETTRTPELLPANRDRDRLLREHLATLLRGGNAHMPFAEAVADFPEGKINDRPPNVAYTFWHLVEHLRLTQADILDYITNTAYEAPDWPRDYWPAPDARATQAEWDASVASFQRDLEALVAIVAVDRQRGGVAIPLGRQVADEAEPDDEDAMAISCLQGERGC